MRAFQTRRKRLFAIGLTLLLLWPALAIGEIHLSLSAPEYGECGVVFVNGGVWSDAGDITGMDWEWGDGTQTTSWFIAKHRYDTDGTYQIVVTARDTTGDSKSESVGALIQGAEEPGCELYRVHLELHHVVNNACGEVQVWGDVWSESGEVTRISWDWDDGTSSDSFFPATHEYTASGSYEVSATAFSGSEQSRTESITVTVDNAETEGCDLALYVHPWQVVLRDGVTEKPLLIDVRDREGRPVNPAQLQLLYEVTWDEIGNLQVSADGVVSATGYGRGGVRVTLQPAGQTLELEVIAGHLRPAPMFQYLSLDGNRVGSVSPDIANADGTTIGLENSQVTYSCNGCGPGQPLQIDEAGNLLLVEDWEPGDPAPLSVNVVVDGQRSEYDAVIHVGVEDLGLTVKDYVTLNTIISSATGAASYDFDAIISEYLMPQLFDLGYEWQEYLMSGVWHGGGRQGLINYTSLSRFDGVFPGCGGSGNPIRTGTNFEEPWLSCFFDNLGAGHLAPNWGVVFHELGHNVTWTADLFGNFAGAGNGFDYSEGLATAAAMFTCEAILRAGLEVGVTEEIADTFERSWLCWRHPVAGTMLAEYVANGSDYSTLTPDLVDDILWTLIQEYDYGLIYRLFGMFTPRSQGGYPFQVATAEQQATMFSIGCSVASGADLKSRFRDEWGFPIDDEIWAQMYPVIEEMIHARYPASNAGGDRTANLGVGTILGDAYVFDQEQDELDLEWTVVSKPPGSIAQFDNASLLNPIFTADSPGKYTLTLQASDQWAEGKLDFMTITVVNPDVIYSSGFEGE